LAGKCHGQATFRKAAQQAMLKDGLRARKRDGLAALSPHPFPVLEDSSSALPTSRSHGAAGVVSEGCRTRAEPRDAALPPYPSAILLPNTSFCHLTPRNSGLLFWQELLPKANPKPFFISRFTPATQSETDSFMRCIPPRYKSMGPCSNCRSTLLSTRWQSSLSPA